MVKIAYPDENRNYPETHQTTLDYINVLKFTFIFYKENYKLKN